MRQIFGLPMWLVIAIALVLCGCVFQVAKKTSSLESFADHSSGGTKVRAVNYWANWCGWSNKFKPEWDKFAEGCKNKKEYEVVDYDCGNDKDTDVQAKCRASGVPGFPSVKIEYTDKDGKEQSIDYNGERTEAALMKKMEEIKAVAA